MARPAARPRLAHRPRPAPPEPARVRAILEALHEARPAARVELDHDSPFRLLIATILSAQCTDARVNQVTPSLFRAWPDAEAFARAPLSDLEKAIRSTGFFRAKARAIKACCQALVDQYGGELPRTLEEMTRLPGVGRKTANVVLGAGYGIPSGIVVDTHVARVAGRLGLTSQTDPVKIERELMLRIPREEWIFGSIALVLHGRYVCQARLARCSACALRAHCPSRDLEAEALAARSLRSRRPAAAGRRRRRAGPRPAPDRS